MSIIYETDSTMNFNKDQFDTEPLIQAQKYLMEAHSGEFRYYFSSLMGEYIQQTKDLEVTAKSLFALTMASIFAIVLGFGGVLVSILNSRSREVGIKLCLGVSLNYIALEFMLEAVLIGVLGGVLGIMGSIPIINLLEFERFDLLVNYKLMCLLLGFSCFIGIVSALFPLSKLNQFQPLNTLK